MPPAPPTFSTITCWPRVSLRPDARMRPIVSTGPPAANGTTMVSARRAGQSCARAGAVRTISANVALNTGLDMTMRGATRSRPRFTRSRGSCGLLDALPDQFGGSADGCGGNGVFELVSGNREGTFLRSAVPIGIGARFDVEDDGLVLHFVFGEVGDATRDDGLVFFRATLVAVVRGKFRQAGTHDGDRIAAVRREDEQASRIWVRRCRFSCPTRRYLRRTPPPTIRQGSSLPERRHRRWALRVIEAEAKPKLLQACFDGSWSSPWTVDGVAGPLPRAPHGNGTPCVSG